MNSAHFAVERSTVKVRTAAIRKHREMATSSACTTSTDRAFAQSLDRRVAENLPKREGASTMTIRVHHDIT